MMDVPTVPKLGDMFVMVAMAWLVAVRVRDAINVHRATTAISESFLAFIVFFLFSAGYPAAVEAESNPKTALE